MISLVWNQKKHLSNTLTREQRCGLVSLISQEPKECSLHAPDTLYCFRKSIALGPRLPRAGGPLPSVVRGCTESPCETRTRARACSGVSAEDGFPPAQVHSFAEHVRAVSVDALFPKPRIEAHLGRTLQWEKVFDAKLTRPKVN